MIYFQNNQVPKNDVEPKENIDLIKIKTVNQIEKPLNINRVS